MRLLVDTHIFYWFFYEETRIPVDARLAMEAADKLYVSAASIWEIAVKVRIGKLKADPIQMIGNLSRSGFLELPITAIHTVKIATMPLHHNDPFDRLLVAQAQAESMRLLTTDSKLSRYGDFVIQV
jgi:PIN domain nuclease of toxin-antitoxin system